MCATRALAYARMRSCHTRPAPVPSPRKEHEPEQPFPPRRMHAEPIVGRHDRCRRPQRPRQPRQGRRLGHRRRAARQVSAQGQVLFGRRRRFRLLRRRVRLGHDGRHLRQHDADRLAQGISRRAREDRPRHVPDRAVGRRRAVLPRRIRRPERRQGSPAADLPAAGAEARAEARREAGLHRDVRDGVRVVQFLRNAAVLGREKRRRADDDHAGDVRLFAVARQRESRVLRGADERDGRIRRADRGPPHRDRPRRLRGGDPVLRSPRSGRPRHPVQDRGEGDRLALRDHAELHGEVESASARAARATFTSRCPTARKTSSTTRRAGTA